MIHDVKRHDIQILIAAERKSLEEPPKYLDLGGNVII